MSNLAYSTLPQQSPRREQPQRQVEIVTTRAQRRARPRPLYALVAIGGLFVLFMAQLLMSIVVSDGAYQISSLQSEQADLTRQQQSLGEQVDTLASTQNLVDKASALGMVQSRALPAFLDVATGKVTGTSHTTKTATTSTSTTSTANLVPNSLLPDATADSTTSDASTGSTSGTTDATTGTTTDSTAGSTTGTTDTATGSTANTGTSTTSTEDPDAAAVTDTGAGAPALTTGTTSVASQGGLPIPVTR